ncbi:MAG: S1/P1 Nuclease, partial [Candidatus Eremiobacteraeota bacterium]|nr:S1/P1 Nuclease [Candidatus Eremiobacteraeota bacterium]
MIKQALFIVAFAGLCGAQALAWGSTGHRMINQVGMQNLPDTLPAFLRTPQSLHEARELGPEMDRLKGSGYPHDGDEDPGHYLDAFDDLSLAGGLHLTSLPDTREAYDTALRTAHTDQYKQGYLPYSIIDGWEAIRKDFAYWRADDYLAQHSASPDDRTWFGADRALREALTLRDIGVWGHYVGDGCQPLHVTVHFNGWDNYPNPKHYSMSHEVHSNFESVYVNAHASQDAVNGIVKSAAPANFITAGATSKGQTAAAISQIENYLAGSARAVIPLYDLDLEGAFTAAGSPKGTDFVN